jgi:hypothetical protein
MQPGIHPTFASNMLFLHNAERVRQRLEQEGIQVVYLKGAAFLDTLYDDISDRPMCDVDILVKHEDRDRTRTVLEAIGYQRHFPSTRAETNRQAYNWAYCGQEPYRHFLEVHTSFCQRQRHAVDYEGLWQRVVRYPTEQREVPTLSPEDTVLAVALHEGKHSFLWGERTSEDLRRVIERWHPDWQVIVQRARQWRLTTTAYVVLLRAQIYGAAVPEWALQELRPRGIRRALALALLDLNTGRARFRSGGRAVTVVTFLVTVEHPFNLVWFAASHGRKRVLDVVEGAANRFRRVGRR